MPKADEHNTYIYIYITSILRVLIIIKYNDSREIKTKLLIY